MCEEETDEGDLSYAGAVWVSSSEPVVEQLSTGRDEPWPRRYVPEVPAYEPPAPYAASSLVEDFYGFYGFYGALEQLGTVILCPPNLVTLTSLDLLHTETLNGGRAENWREADREVVLTPTFSNATFSYSTIIWPLGNLTFNWTTVRRNERAPLLANFLRGQANVPSRNNRARRTPETNLSLVRLADPNGCAGCNGRRASLFTYAPAHATPQTPSCWSTPPHTLVKRERRREKAVN